MTSGDGLTARQRAKAYWLCMEHFGKLPAECTLDEVRELATIETARRIVTEEYVRYLQEGGRPW